MTRLVYQQAFIPSPDSARAIREQIRQVLQNLGAAEQTVRPMELAVSEWIMNLATHSRPYVQNASISLQRADGQWLFAVNDDGGEFVGFNDVPQLPDDPLQASGRGLYLLHQACPNVAYLPGNARNKHNQLILPISELVQDKPRILLVDDDPSQVALLSAYLARQYAVHTCCSGQQALDRLHNETFDLVISDIDMPDMGGIELRERLLGNPSLDTLPFIFVSGSEQVREPHVVSELAIDDFLRKPVRHEQLHAVVSRVLERSAQMRRRLSDYFDKQLTACLHPQLPDNGRWMQAQVWSRAATAGGGDLIQYVEQPQQELVIFADLMGHGASAKFAAHLVGGYVRGLLAASPDQPSPAALMSRLSAALYHDKLLAHTLMTLFIVRFCSAHHIDLVNAGQPRPWWFDGERWKQLNLGGSLPGMQANAAYSQCRIPLAPGQFVLLCSDGVWEVGSSAQERAYNEKVLMQLISNNRHPDRLLAKIKAWYQQVCPLGGRDDTTIVLLGQRG
ncbi:SpoIIE family protein phosphatase [Bowmanella sp. JS7-9]|uniref:SpoIIE family protein phosphatase n=1 Tax=Pseudobowmanella zhangzhouensis TaxID=1537679 RepID=A0ABW1XGG7_9ALTE|nr:SpoIIE family protein phosphatase [Bowmanella sp. JS7-9]TBX24685.1 hypothetical protein TK45_04475 [Bowmanella sp. JS7-9]